MAKEMGEMEKENDNVPKETEKETDMVAAAVHDLTAFLLAPNPQLRSVAVTNIFALTGDPAHLATFRANPKAVRSLVEVAISDPLEPIRKQAMLALINLTADHSIADWLAENVPSIGHSLVEIISDRDSILADTAAGVLANYTRSSEKACALLIEPANQDETAGEGPERESGGEKLSESDRGGEEKKESDGAGEKESEKKKDEVNEKEKATAPPLSRLVDIFCNESYNTQGQNLDWIAAVFSNTTRLANGRAAVTNRNSNVFQRLLSFTQHPSITRRGGVLGTVRNLTMDTTEHKWLLGPDVDLLPYLLLPLAGPEELSADDMEDMPDDLQYLPPDKQREIDPELRKMVLESLLQLGATREGRRILKAKKTYPIIREFYNWETNPALEKPTMDLVQLLIADEPHVDNLKTLDTGEMPQGDDTEPERIDGSGYQDGIVFDPRGVAPEN